jgi:DNA-binding response OmpR family regulator
LTAGTEAARGTLAAIVPFIVKLFRSDTLKEDGNLCILIVEDDPAIESLVSLGLRYAHFRVIATDNGLSGLQLFEEHKPDLVILDWLLPGMDGLKLCRMIRSHRQKMGQPPLIQTVRGVGYVLREASR